MNDSPTAAPDQGLGELLSPGLLTLHAVADLVAALALTAIAVAIYFFAWHRRGRPGESSRDSLILGTLFLMMGLGFAITFATLFGNHFLLQGVMAAVTAVVAVGMAAAVLRAMPRELPRPSPAAMEQMAAERRRELSRIMQRFEAATSGAQITVLALDPDLTVTWVHNPWPGLSADALLGRRSESLAPPLADAFVRHGLQAIGTGHPVTFELDVARTEEETSWFRITMTPFRDDDGQVAGLVSTAMDISAPKRLEAMRADLSRRLAETVQRFNLALRSSDVLVFSLGTGLGDLWANTDDPKLSAILGAADRVDEDGRPNIASLMRRAMDNRQTQYDEVSVGEGAHQAWYDLHVEPRIAASGEVVGVVCAAVDVTERKRNEQRMRLVMRELSHRSKNLLAVVQAIARQTAQRAPSVPAFVDGFGQRLRSLAGAQDLLVAENWAGAQLEGLILSQIGPHLPEEDRVRVEGPPVTLTPEATQTIALAIHELATNAVKHGALSTEVGEVRVTWSLDEASLLLLWQESGGPKIEGPASRGFGRVVIEFNVARSLNADVNLELPPTGAMASFRIPRQHLIEARAKEVAGGSRRQRPSTADHGPGLKPS